MWLKNWPKSHILCYFQHTAMKARFLPNFKVRHRAECLECTPKTTSSTWHAATSHVSPRLDAWLPWGERGQRDLQKFGKLPSSSSSNKGESSLSCSLDTSERSTVATMKNWERHSLGPGMTWLYVMGASLHPNSSSTCQKYLTFDKQDYQPILHLA